MGPFDGETSIDRLNGTWWYELSARDKRSLTKEEREAKKEQSRKDAESVLAARKKEDDAFRANFERLKAERLARQAAGKS